MEILPYHEHYEEREVESKLIPGKIITDWGNGTTYCPRCKTSSFGEIPHGTIRQCEKCDLYMGVLGNALHIAGKESSVAAILHIGSGEVVDGKIRDA